MRIRKIALTGALLSFYCGCAFALDPWEVSDEGAKSGEYSFLVYAVTWQPTFCLLKGSEGCKNDEAKFYVHGIWPYFSYQKQKEEGKDNTHVYYNYHPANCTVSPGCADQNGACPLTDNSRSLLLENQDFQNNVTSVPQGLMEHEWKKHGTCYGGDQNKYFTDFYKFRDKVVRYNKEEFSRAEGQSKPFAEIKSWFPANVRFRCDVKDNVQYLYEVFYLVDREGNAFTDNSAKPLQIGKPCELKQTMIPVI